MFVPRSYFNFCICVLVVLFYGGGKACVVSTVLRCLDLLDLKCGLISELHLNLCVQTVHVCTSEYSLPLSD